MYNDNQDLEPWFGITEATLHRTDIRQFTVDDNFLFAL